MRILIDTGVFYLQSTGGISRVVASAANALSKYADVTLTYDVGRSGNIYANELRGFTSLKNAPAFRRLPIVPAPGSWDIVIQPYLGIVLTKTRLRICILHDFIVENHESGFRKYLHSTLKIITMHWASRIVCISNATRAEAERRPLLTSFRRKLAVVHNGLDMVRFPPRACESYTPRNAPSILYVGRRDEYKNFGLCAEIIRSSNDLRLVVVGKSFSESEVRKYVDIKDRVSFKKNISDVVLLDEIRNAACLVFPSREEGFGLPALEAASQGTPVVMLDLPFARELKDLVGELVILSDEVSFVATVLSVIERRTCQEIFPPVKKLPTWDVWARDIICLE